MLVAEGMNSRRSRRASFCAWLPMREHGAGGAFSAIFIDVVELATIEPGVRADLATQGGSTFTFDWYALIARTRPLEWPPRPSGASSAGVVHRLARTGLGAALLARICYLPRLAGASLPAWRRALCASLLLASQPRQRSLSCFAAFTSRCAAESSTALSAFAIDIDISCSACHSAREAAALWPGAGHAAPASDFLEILILESLDARLVAAFPASIFMAVVKHFGIYFSV